MRRYSPLPGKLGAKVKKKAIGFGLIYGMTTGSLQYKLNKTPEEAQQIAQQYWNTFPRIQPWLNEVIKDCTQNGLIRYWSGRIWRENDPMKAYKGANAQIQGGAADLMSVAIVRADEVIEHMGWGGVASIIHDEAIFEIKDECLEEAVPIIAKIMEVEDLFNLPFPTDVKIGKSYGTLGKPNFSVFIDGLNWEDYKPSRDSRDSTVPKEVRIIKEYENILAEAA